MHTHLPFTESSSSFRPVPHDLLAEITADCAVDAAKANAEYFSLISETVDKIKQSGYTDQTFVAFEKAYNQTHCLIYYKHRQIEGDTYDVEINLLQRTVSLIPV